MAAFELSSVNEVTPPVNFVKSMSRTMVPADFTMTRLIFPAPGSAKLAMQPMKRLLVSAVSAPAMVAVEPTCVHEPGAVVDVDVL